MTTRSTVTADGSTAIFTVPFPYLDRSHVKVMLDGVLQSPAEYSWNTSGAIMFGTAPAAGTDVTIYRSTPVAALTAYQSGSVLTRDQLEVDSLQALYLVEEMESKSFRLPDSLTNTVNLELPTPSGLDLIGWSADGLGIRNFGVAELGLELASGAKFQALVTAGATSVPLVVPTPYEIQALFYNGVYQRPESYTQDGDTITFAEPLADDGVVNVIATVVALGESTDSANFIYTPSGGATRTLQARLSDDLSVKDFGAVGDGVTDDTAAFEAAEASGLPIDVPPGDYYLTKNFTNRTWTAKRGGVQFTNAGWRVTEFGFNLNGRGDQQAMISMTHTIDGGNPRQELKIYQGNGAALHLYGNQDTQHAGNFAVMTGQVGAATARLIVSGYNDLVGSGGERYNADTRVTIGNDIWNFVDNKLDVGMLNLVSPASRPALYISASDSFGDIATGAGEGISIGQFNGTTGVFAQSIRIDTSRNFLPGSDNDLVLGSAARRWEEVFSGTGAINTSDERDKQQIGEIPDAVLDAWGDVQYRQFKFNDSVAAKGNDARWHVGHIAQQIESAFAARGLNAFDYGILCYDEWEDDPKNQVVAGNRYSIRPDECSFMESAYMRRELARLKEKL